MAMTLITTNSGTNQTVSSFTSSIDSTYKLYIFSFYDVNPATDSAEFTFQANVAGASDYNEEITSATFYMSHSEADGDASYQYTQTHDQAEGTAFQPISWDLGNGADESCAGELWLFDPSNTTYKTQFMAEATNYEAGNRVYHSHTGGYFDSAAAIVNIQFKMSSGNMDSVIKMYGVS
mgnify:FL=1